MTFLEEQLKWKINFLSLGIFLLSLFPIAAAGQYEHPDLKTGKKVIKNVVILPPSATLWKSGMKSNETLVAESGALELGLTSVVAKTLSDMDCTVIRDTLNPDVLDQNPDLKYSLSDLQTRYDKLHVLIKKKPKDVRKGRFTMGDEVANFSPGAAVDALVFVRANGIVVTNGKKAFVALTGMGVMYNHVTIDIAVVDAHSGAILYFAKSGSGGNFVGNPDSMRAAVSKSFSIFTPNIPPRK